MVQNTFTQKLWLGSDDIYMNNNEKYEDIINLPHHVSKKHPQMSLDARSAQFAPFAALTGYDDVIEETARVTNTRKEINEELKMILDNKLQIIMEHILDKPEITVTYFKPDLKKSGGTYEKVTGKVIRIDRYKQLIVLENKIEILISNISDININEMESLWITE